MAIICLNLLNEWVALRVATDDAFANAFGPAGSDALTGLFAGMHHDGYLIAQIFFGCWPRPLGYLVIKSGWFPTWIGVLLIAGCFGYLVDTFATFLSTSPTADTIEAVVVAPAAIGELSFVAYLLMHQGRAGSREEPLPLAPS